jgi:signal peptidase II
MKRPGLYGLAAAAAVIILDQISKAAVLAHIDEPVKILPVFNLVLVWNEGISFGIFNDGAAGPLILTGLSLVITAFLLIWLWRAAKAPLAIALGLVIGGALGNVLDRLGRGAVVDFLDFHAGQWHWPAFNVADSCIVMGVAFLVLDGLFFEPKEKRHELPENN